MSSLRFNCSVFDPFGDLVQDFLSLEIAILVGDNIFEGRRLGLVSLNESSLEGSLDGGHGFGELHCLSVADKFECVVEVVQTVLGDLDALFLVSLGALLGVFQSVTVVFESPVLFSVDFSGLGWGYVAERGSPGTLVRSSGTTLT